MEKAVCSAATNALMIRVTRWTAHALMERNKPPVPHLPLQNPTPFPRNRPLPLKVSHIDSRKEFWKFSVIEKNYQQIEQCILTFCFHILNLNFLLFALVFRKWINIRQPCGVFRFFYPRSGARWSGGTLLVSNHRNSVSHSIEQVTNRIACMCSRQRIRIFEKPSCFNFCLFLDVFRGKYKLNRLTTQKDDDQKEGTYSLYTCTYINIWLQIHCDDVSLSSN